jgi:hypothetical protein
MEEEIVKIENWSTVNLAGTPFSAPEPVTLYLQGNIYGHPDHDDGNCVTTNYIISVDERIVTTASGTKYLLGEEDPIWLEWLEKNNIEFDSENPIKLPRG